MGLQWRICEFLNLTESGLRELGQKWGWLRGGYAGYVLGAVYSDMRV